VFGTVDYVKEPPGLHGTAIVVVDEICRRAVRISLDRTAEKPQNPAK